MPLIETGWEAYRKTFVPRVLGMVWVRRLRQAYFAGAGTTFMSVVALAGKGDHEPTETETGAVSAIADELKRFGRTSGQDFEHADRPWPDHEEAEAGRRPPRFVPEPPPEDPAVIQTHSIVSHRDGRGVVVVEWHGHKGLFDSEDARLFAHTLLREADNAETDAYLYSFMKGKGASPRQIAVNLTAYREHRAKLQQLAGLRPTGQEVPEEDRR